jgi:site-specific DNA recombinase
MTRAAISVRVSTRKQAETGYGLDAQLAACHEYVIKQGYELVDTYTDVITGITSERPGLEALIEAIPLKHIDVVVMPEIDRASRDFAEFVVIKGELQEAGARIEYAIGANFSPDDEDGWLMENLIAMLADRERRRLLRKMNDGIKAKVASGQIFASRAPYGYKLVATVDQLGKRYNSFAIDEVEAPIVVLIYTWYTAGDGDDKPSSVYAIAQRLTEMGVPTRADTTGERTIKRVNGYGVWSERMVRLILGREDYTGVWYWGKTKSVKKALGSKETKQIAVPRSQWKSVPIPIIIDRETWDLAQVRADDNRKRASRNGHYNYLFTGRLTCLTCGYALVGHNVRARGTHTEDYPHYRHSRKLPNSMQCFHHTVNEKDLDDTLWQWVTEVVSDPNKVEQQLMAVQQGAEQRNAPTRQQIAILDKQITELGNELNDLQLWLVKRKITETFFDEHQKRLEQQSLELQRRRSELDKKLESGPHTPPQIENIRAFCAMVRQRLGKPGRIRRHERALGYDLLDMTAKITIEDGVRVAYAMCIFDTKRLTTGRLSDTSER